MTSHLRATVHVGPKGGTEYRLWTTMDTFRVVGKYAALQYLSDEEQAKAAAIEKARKDNLKKESEREATWRYIQRGG